MNNYINRLKQEKELTSRQRKILKLKEEISFLTERLTYYSSINSSKTKDYLHRLGLKQNILKAFEHNN